MARVVRTVGETLYQIAFLNFNDNKDLDIREEVLKHLIGHFCSGMVEFTFASMLILKFILSVGK